MEYRAHHYRNRQVISVLSDQRRQKYRLSHINLRSTRSVCHLPTRQKLSLIGLLETSLGPFAKILPTYLPRPAPYPCHAQTFAAYSQLHVEPQEDSHPSTYSQHRKRQPSVQLEAWGPSQSWLACSSLHTTKQPSRPLGALGLFRSLQWGKLVPGPFLAIPLLGHQQAAGAADLREVGAARQGPTKASERMIVLKRASMVATLSTCMILMKGNY